MDINNNKKNIYLLAFFTFKKKATFKDEIFILV